MIVNEIQLGHTEDYTYRITKVLKTYEGEPSLCGVCAYHFSYYGFNGEGVEARTSELVESSLFDSLTFDNALSILKNSNKIY